MAKEAMSNPCAECPFRTGSLKGYLGPWTPRGILEQAFSEAGLACHMTVEETGKAEGTKICTGSLICANKSAKRFRDSELRTLQDAVSGHRGGVFDQWQFLDYHGEAGLRSMALEDDLEMDRIGDKWRGR